MLGDMGKMMKQLSEMKSQMSVMEKELKSIVITQSDKNNLVTVSLSGKLDLKEIALSDEFLECDKAKMEKAVTHAVDAALREAQNVAAKKLKESGSLGNLGIPGL